MKRQRRLIHLLFAYLVLTLAILLPRPDAGAPVKVLLLVSNLHGSYFSYVLDQMETYGWDVTVVGVTPTVTPCEWGQTFAVDTLVTEITDVSPYDCLLISQSAAYAGQANQQLLESLEALDLVRHAVQDSLLVAAICGGTRVLAAADVIEGKRVTGYVAYSQEYVNAGGIWLGADVPPVLDGNILTSAKGHYYSHQICEAMRAAIDSLRTARGRQ
jgi:putative intracellular protease/amidase